MGIIGNILEAQRSTAALPLAGGVLTGNVVLGDNIKAFFGTSSDASIYYDGTNLVINPKEVGSGVLSVLGDVNSSSTIRFEVSCVASNIDSYLATHFVGGSILRLKAIDLGVGYVDIAQMVSAADPYLQILRDDVGVALNAVTDGLVLGMGAGTGNEAAGFGLGIPIKLGNAASQVEERLRINGVLQTATDASEDASFILRAMVAGAMVTVMSFGGYVGVSKLGFYATAPVALQTGVAVSAAGIHAALVNLGLITA